MRASHLLTDNLNATGKIIINRGGTRSGKTVAIVQAGFKWLVGSNDKGFWSICRKTLPALKATAYRDFLDVCDMAGIYPQHNRSDMTFTFGPRTVEFFSLDDQQKVRSRKRRHLHIVESNEIDFEMFTQMALRTNGKIYLDFNPDDPDTWIRTELEEKRATVLNDVTVIRSTYLDNPFLSADEVQEIEYLKSVDENLWNVFGRGEYGTISGQVFPKYELIDEMPLNTHKVFTGVDFGFHPDPAAVIRVAMVNNRLYLDELVYERRLNNQQLAERLDKKITHVADSAEPKSIDELQRYGISCIPAVKGPDSVRAGLQRMGQFEIFVTRRSVNLLKELKLYRLDTHGNPVGPDHAIDAARYVVQTMLRPNNEFGRLIKVNNYGSAVR